MTEFVEGRKLVLREHTVTEITLPFLARKFNRIREKIGAPRIQRIDEILPAQANVFKAKSTEEIRDLRNFFSIAENKIGRKLKSGKVASNQIDRLLRELPTLSNQYLRNNKAGLAALDNRIKFYTRKKLVH